MFFVNWKIKMRICGYILVNVVFVMYIISWRDILLIDEDKIVDECLL